MAITVSLSSGQWLAQMTNGSAVVVPYVNSNVTLTNGSVAIASPSSTSNWAINAVVSGTGIPAGTRLRYNGTSWELSQAFTGATGVVSMSVCVTNAILAPLQLTLTNGSTAITGTTTSLVQGAFITGVGIPDGTFVSTNGTTWTLSQAFTGTTGATWVTVENRTANPTNNTLAGLQNSGWQVGAVVQATGLASVTRINSTICGVSATLSNPFTGTTGNINPNVSSVQGATIFVTLDASGDTASPRNIISAGFANDGGPKIINFIGGARVQLQLATGAVYDDTDWTYNFQRGGGIGFNESYGCGTWRSGYILNGSTFVKAKGHTVNYNNYFNTDNAGGRTIFTNTGSAPPGYVAGTTMPTIQWNDTAWIEQTGFNAAAFPTAVYSTFNCGRLVFDYAADTAGANAGYGGSFGTIESLLFHRAIGGVSTGINSSSLVSVGKFEYFSIPSTGQEVRFSFPSLIPYTGFAPLIYQVPATATNICCNTFSYEIGVDPTFPVGLNYRTNNRNFSNGQREYRRTVSFTLKDTTGAALTNTTLYINSSAGTLINAVQAGDFSQPVKSHYMAWYGPVGSYRIPSVFEDYSTQVAQFRKNGYVEQVLPAYSIADVGYSQPVFLALDPAYGSVTPAAAAAVTGVTPNYGSQTLEISESRNLDEVYGSTGFSLALTANSQYPNFRSNSGGAFMLASPWQMQILSGEVTMGTFNNKLFGSKPLNVYGGVQAHCTSGGVWGDSTRTWNGNEIWGVFKTYTSDGKLTLGTSECVWTPSVYADMPTFNNGAEFSLPAGSKFTIRPTVSLGFSMTTMFGLNSKWTMNNSSIEFDMGSINNYNGSFFSAFSSNNTCVVNFTNAVWTINGTGTNPNPFTHLYWSPSSVINGWTINGTRAQNTTLNMSVTPIKLTGFSAPCILTGALSGATTTVPLDGYTYTGTLSALRTVLGRQSRWSFLDAARSDGAVFRWDAGTTTTGDQGYYAVLHFRPTIAVANNGYAPRVRLTPSALATRYPSKTFTTTANSTIALSNFYQDSTMSPSDGSLPFVDSLDDKTALTIIDWTLDFRAPGFLDSQRVFAGATAKKGQITYTSSGVVDANYVNASTGLADSALIVISTTAKTIAPVSGTLTWSPQRLYNAIKNWWATYASDLDFVAATSGGFLDLGDFSVDANFRFGVPTTGDALVNVRTTGLINAATNDIAVTDSRGRSTLFSFVNVLTGSTVYLEDNTGTQRLLVTNTSVPQYNVYIEPGATGNWKAKIRKYGYQSTDVTFTPPGGGFFIGSDNVVDIYVVDTLANASAYTDLNTAQKIYDYSTYWMTTSDGIRYSKPFDKGFGTLTANQNWVLDPAAVTLLTLVSGTVTTKTSGLSEEVTLVINGSYTQGTAAVSNDVKIRANNIDSELLFSGISSVTVYATVSDALTGTNPGASSSTGSIRFKYGASLSGVTMSGTVYVRILLGATIEVLSLNLVTGTNILDLSTTTLLQSVLVNLDDIKGTGFQKDVHSLTNIKKKASLAAALSA